MIDKKEKILDFMKNEAYKPLSLKDLAFMFQIKKSEQDLLKEVLEQLESEGKIFKTKREKYGIPERMNLVIGQLQTSERGYGFIIPDDETIKDIFISANNLNGGMNGDKVVARVNKNPQQNKRAEGEIIKIINRANNQIIGTFEKSRNFGFVVPDDRKFSGDIFIPKSKFNNAKTGDKVVVMITVWPEKRRNAEGDIIEILGKKSDIGVDILSIVKSYGLNEEFPNKVLEQANSISDIVSQDMIKGRRDLRSLQMVTIDGEDAKDLDDAVSIQKLEEDNYRLGVHIADVSYYVTENSPLDKEAQKRGTSVYLVDRVIPMLPRKLSNGICSLNPNVDRLAFSVMMDVDKNGNVFNYEIFESIININERMTYTNVYKILEENDKDLLTRYDYLVNDFKLMKELALILKERRLKRGTIDFNFDEPKIVLDTNGTPIDIKKYEITIANNIIEEFMLLCNETVAEHFFWANSPFVYRIHEEPDKEKIEILSDFVSNLGYSLKGINKIHPMAFQNLLSKVKGKKEERIVSTVMLRSMQKARYSNINSGHFGLAAKYYCHFTSPIRRYPDLIIHRIMKESIKRGNLSQERQNHLNSILPEIAKQCSICERAAEDAERETQDLKKVEYMKKYIGYEFEAIISNITSFGMFVELDNTIEGLVKLSSMEEDYYIFDDKKFMLIGERTRKIFRIGDLISVKLVKSDISTKQIDFVIL